MIKIKPNPNAYVGWTNEQYQEAVLRLHEEILREGQLVLQRRIKKELAQAAKRKTRRRRYDKQK